MRGDKIVSLRNVDPSLWRRVKAAAAESDVSITVYAQDALRAFLSQPRRSNGGAARRKAESR